MSKNDQKNLFIGSLIMSVIGAALLLFGEFAGYHDYWYSGGHFNEWGYVRFGTGGEGGILASILIGSFAAGLLYCAYVSYLGVTSKMLPSYSLVRNAKIAALVSMIGVAIGGIGFMIGTSGDDDQWLSEGFFGGIIGAALTFLMFRKQEEYYLEEQPAK
jgi:hypothetical protein